MRIDSIWWGESSTQYISSNEKASVAMLCDAELQTLFARIREKDPIVGDNSFVSLLILILSSHLNYEVGTPPKK